LFEDLKLKVHDRGLANVGIWALRKVMVGLRDSRLVINCINFTHHAKWQVLMVTAAAVS
jgi:hypothetical protein